MHLYSTHWSARRTRVLVKTRYQLAELPRHLIRGFHHTGLTRSGMQKVRHLELLRVLQE